MLKIMLVAAVAMSAAPKKAPAPTCTEAEQRAAALTTENERLKALLTKNNIAVDGSEPAAAAPASTAIGTEGYGKVKWGAALEEVKAAYPDAHPVKDNLVVEGRVAGHEASTYFIFANGKLSVVAVSFRDSYQNKNAYLDEHRELAALLTEKYGAPTTDAKDYWSNSLYKDDRERWGMGVSVGHLKRISTWDTLETQIELVTKGENFELSNHIRYGSIRLAAEAEAARKKRLSDDL